MQKKCIENKVKGNIVITSSTLSITSAPNRCAYTASKHATAGMTKQLALDLAKYDIRVNAVGPGVIRTPYLNYQNDHKHFSSLL